MTRIVSVAAVGWPFPVFTGAMVIELVVIPVLLLWHVRAFPSGTKPSGGSDPGTSPRQVT